MSTEQSLTLETQEDTISPTLTLSAVDSLVRTFPCQEHERDLPERHDLDFGGKCSVSFASYDRDSSLWRTSQGCLFPSKDNTLQLDEFSETWPLSGMTHNGIAYQLAPSAPLISDEESSLWPTPTASDDRKGYLSQYVSLRNPKYVPEIGTTDLWLSPRLSEWLMGYPENWLNSKPSETPSFLKSPNILVEESSISIHIAETEKLLKDMDDES